MNKHEHVKHPKRSFNRCYLILRSLYKLLELVTVYSTVVYPVYPRTPVEIEFSGFSGF